MNDPTSSSLFPVQHCGEEVVKGFDDVDHLLVIAVNFSDHFVVCKSTQVK